MKGISLRMAAVVLTAWLGFASGAANATLLTLSGSPSTGYGSIFGNSAVSSPFNDWYTFTIPSGAAGNGTSNVISLGATNVIFTLFELYDGLNFMGAGVTGGTTSALSFSGGTVPGSYNLYVNGYKVNPLLNGTYSGNLSINPVPEPETFAMMLAGLGLLGLSARRRNKNS